MKQIGKIGKKNIKANKLIKKMFLERDILWCELNEPHNCNQFIGTSFAHRHKRDFYKGYPDIYLSHYNQVILICFNGHDLIEYDKQKTIDVFQRLRGDDLLQN